MPQRSVRAGRVWQVVLFFAVVSVVGAQAPAVVDGPAENERLKQAVRVLTEKLAVARA